MHDCITIDYCYYLQSLCKTWLKNLKKTCLHPSNIKMENDEFRKVHIKNR